ncbi:MAG: hypothetical protein CMO55_04460 [Verrucomicrobiales bacterium]|nr:hypothetical protein [Verrucomicrobiales bacterium]
MDLDTRAEAQRQIGLFQRKLARGIAKVAIAVLVSFLVVLIPDWIGWSAFKELDADGRFTLGLLAFAAFLWITEAIPAFAVAVLVIGLEVVVLGMPGGFFASTGDTKAWQQFVEPWASPLMWLFLGGFVLASGTEKTGLDRWVAASVLSKASGSPVAILATSMGITFLLSMFMSNTATATMMIAVLAPLVATGAGGKQFATALYLAIPIAANVGGMATIIGTPPNALASTELGEQGFKDIASFAGWMKIGVVPSLFLGGFSFLYLWIRYLRKAPDSSPPALTHEPRDPTPEERIQFFVVVIVFLTTVVLWMTESLHGIPAPVTAFFPMVAFAATGVLGPHDVRKLPWDILLLLGGGLALGKAVQVTGLAEWMGNLIPDTWTGLPLMIGFGLLAVLLSNLMSNTATASLLIPLGVGLAGESELAALLALIAMSCSSAMALPISTPPNAVAYSTGKVRSQDFLEIGLIMAILGPAISIIWINIVT